MSRSFSGLLLVFVKHGSHCIASPLGRGLDENLENGKDPLAKEWIPRSQGGKDDGRKGSRRTIRSRSI
jgi:hypothetical protein